MNSLSSVREDERQVLSPDAASHNARDYVPYPRSDATMAAQLRAAQLRVAELLQDKENLAQRQVMLSQEFEHRLINGLQLISSLLSLQSRSATTPEATAQLSVAAKRVAALGRVHHLHVLDHQDRVEFKPYLERLCHDLADLLPRGAAASCVRVECVEADLPTAFAIPLGFIVNELITNSAKHGGGGGVTVQFEATSPDGYSLSVVDEGPGLPDGFDPARSKGLGMRIVMTLVQQIRGKLHVESGDDGGSTRFRVTFLSAGTKGGDA